MGGIPELQQGHKLLRVVEAWLREEKRKRRDAAARGGGAAAPAPQRPNPLLNSRHAAYYR